VLWIFREIHRAAQEELSNETDSITAELSQLYMMLETGKISEVEFAAGERTLLERLDGVQERNQTVRGKGGRHGAQDQSARGRAA
jgi:hypothetical protein